MTEYKEMFAYLGYALKFFRNQTGKKQAEVAEIAGIDLRHYQKLEAGKLLNVTLDTLYRVSGALDSDLSDLLKTKTELNTYKNKIFSPNKCSEIESKLELFNNLKILSSYTNINGIYNQVFNEPSFESFFDHSGLIYNGNDYLGPKTMRDTAGRKKLVTGEYSQDKSNIPMMTYLQGMDRNSSLFSRHSAIVKGRKFEIALLTKVAYILNQKPVILFAGIECLGCSNSKNCEYFSQK